MLIILFFLSFIYLFLRNVVKTVQSVFKKTLDQTQSQC